MLKSVTKWLGVDDTAKPDDADKEHDAVEIAQTEAKERKENTTTKRSPPESESKSKDDGKKPASTEEKTSEDDGDLDDSTATVGALHKLEDATAVAFDTAKQVGNMLYSFGRTAGFTMVEQASKLKNAVQEKRLLGDFSVEQEKFTAEIKEFRKKVDDAVAPWVGYHEEETMKQQILALSTERKHFLVDPPSDAKYKFDFATAYPVALATLHADPNLRKMRFELVPKKLSEERFWGNYFYWVSLIKQSVQLETLEQQQSAGVPPSGKENGNGSHADADDESRATLTQTQSLHKAHLRPDPQPGSRDKPTARVEEAKAAAAAPAAVAASKEKEEEEDDVDEDWEQVLRQDVEDYVKVGEGGTYDSRGTSKGDGQTSDRPDDEEDPEILDLLQQIEQETDLAASS